MSSAGFDQQRVNALHYQSFIHDYYPLALPLSVDKEMEEYMRQAIVEEKNGNAVIYEFLNFYLKRLESGGPQSEATREKLKVLFGKTGVNCITPTLGNASKPLDDYDSILKSREWYDRLFNAFEYFQLCTTAKDIITAWKEDRVGIFFALQDMGCIGNDLKRIEALYRMGIRIGQLTYNGPNAIGCGCAVPPEKGLNDFGREAVKEMNRQGILVDLSHCNYQTTMDGLSASALPPIISHSSCKAVFDHPRSKSDEELRLLADRDGYVGIFSVPFFLTDAPDPDYSIFLKHLEHAVEIAGIERVGIGSDWGLWSSDVPKDLQLAMIEAARKMGFGKNMNIAVGSSLKGMQDYTDWICFTEALVSAGYSDAEIKGFLGENFLNYLTRAGFAE